MLSSCDHKDAGLLRLLRDQADIHIVRIRRILSEQCLRLLQRRPARQASREHSRLLRSIKIERQVVIHPRPERNQLGFQLRDLCSRLVVLLPKVQNVLCLPNPLVAALNLLFVFLPRQLFSAVQCGQKAALLRRMDIQNFQCLLRQCGVLAERGGCL